MKGWLRKIKAALGIGALWGMAGGVVGGTIGALTGLAYGAVLDGFVLGMASVAVAAGVLGTAFAGVLSLMERRRTLDELTPRRAGLWGAVVGGTLPVLTGVVALATGGAGRPLSVQLPALAAGAVAYATVTAVLAAGTVALAKRSDSQIGPGAGEPMSALAEGGKR